MAEGRTTPLRSGPGRLLTFFYGLLLTVVRQLMRERPRFELRSTMVAWNVFLAMFSMMGAARTLPELIHVFGNHGVYASTCVPRWVT